MKDCSKSTSNRNRRWFRRGWLLPSVLFCACLCLTMLYQNAEVTIHGTEQDAPQTKALAAGSAKKMKVVAYYPSWKPNDMDKLRFDVITHVNYAFAIPNKDGSLKPLENPDLAKKIIKKAHQNQAKVLLAVGGWSYQGAELEPVFKAATSSSQKIKKLGDAIYKLCKTYGFDGVDMDWEHPRVDDGSGKQYEKLMVYLSKKLHNNNMILTSAVLSGVSPAGTAYYDAKAHSAKVIKAVDWLNVMAYDGDFDAGHSTYGFAQNCIKYWKNTRKVPAAKLVLGVPFYCRPMGISYSDLLAANPKAGAADQITYQGTKVYYNGIATIKKKTSYAKKQAGGVMIWEITQDTAQKKQSLLTAIGEAAK